MSQNLVRTGRARAAALSRKLKGYGWYVTPADAQITERGVRVKSAQDGRVTIDVTFYGHEARLDYAERLAMHAVGMGYVVEREHASEKPSGYYVITLSHPNWEK